MKSFEAKLSKNGTVIVPLVRGEYESRTDRIGTGLSGTFSVPNAALGAIMYTSGDSQLEIVGDRTWNISTMNSVGQGGGMSLVYWQSNGGPVAIKPSEDAPSSDPLK